MGQKVGKRYENFKAILAKNYPNKGIFHREIVE